MCEMLLFITNAGASNTITIIYFNARILRTSPEKSVTSDVSRLTQSHTTGPLDIKTETITALTKIAQSAINV